MLLVSAVALPLTLFSAGSIWSQYGEDRERAEAQLVAQARTLAQLVDQEFERTRAVAQTLTASAALGRGDLDAFDRELRAARDLLSAGLPNGVSPVMLRLVRLDGMKLLDTAWPPGVRRTERVPMLPHLAAALASGRVEISDLFVPRKLNLPFISVVVPVFLPWGQAEGRAGAVIGVTLPRERFASVVSAAGLPAASLASVQDRRGMTVVRSYRDGETVGRVISPEALSAIMGGEAGVVPSGLRTLEGVPSAMAFAHAPDSDYTVMLELPEDVFQAPLRRTLLRSLLTGGVILAMGLMVALLVAGRVVSALGRVPWLAPLAPPGALAEVGRFRTTGMREADTLAQALSVQLGERQRAERALRDSEARFRTLADAMPQMVWSADPDGRHTYFNARWHAFTGIVGGQFPGGDWLSLVHPEDRERLTARWRHSLETGEPYEMEYRLRRHDGVHRWALARALPMRDAAGRIVQWFGSSTDIEEIVRAREVMARSRLELEQQVEARTRALDAARAELAQAQRMEALGKLAGGIAHDFNNVLQAVQGGAALIERRPDDAERVRRLGRMILEASGRGMTITRRLLSFARRGDLRAEPVDAAMLLGNMREMLAHTLGSGVEVRVHVPPGLPPLLADQGQLETVLVNLATNARDAMAGHGLLVLGAAEDVVPAESAAGYPARLAAGRYLRLSVADTGSGMDPETLARASEPFFTTKLVGKGTGLGLSMAKGFAEQSGGALVIESAPGRGTQVALWFPVSSEAPAGREAAEPGPPALPLLPPEERRRILLVDDEALVRSLLAEQLEAAGYAVSVAGSGAAALEMVEQGAAPELLVSDLSMPGMDGLALIQEMQRRRPGLPAVLLTGFVTNAAEIAMGGALDGSFSLLSKPVDAGRLADRIAVMLEAADGRAAVE
ncbi:response regulator [Pararoseomonas baculiformis]|nr:response regulator [Pararoseomonas baculiformis]